ncbi:MAG: hypothetical protein HY537_11705 [Deltaproteobacteria bacterium]|nr:hypothetical protein [Deltaproteobacteria bacterium]
MDALERERLRKKMAIRMMAFLESGGSVSCVSGHYYDEPHPCDLCLDSHATDLLVIKNRSGKKLRVASNCLMEMVRFQVAEVDDFPRWLEKLKELRVEAEKRKQQALLLREEERQRLGRKVIVRKRQPNA